jgi:phage regulator Rha-like protein
MIHLDINLKIANLIKERHKALLNDILEYNKIELDATDMISEKDFLEGLAKLLEVQL